MHRPRDPLGRMLEARPPAARILHERAKRLLRLGLRIDASIVGFDNEVAESIDETLLISCHNAGLYNKPPGAPQKQVESDDRRASIADIICSTSSGGSL